MVVHRILSGGRHRLGPQLARMGIMAGAALHGLAVVSTLLPASAVAISCVVIPNV